MVFLHLSFLVNLSSFFLFIEMAERHDAREILRIARELILELQKLDTKVVKEEMAKDGIYLSDHEPEFLSYLILLNYFLTEKIDFEL